MNRALYAALIAAFIFLPLQSHADDSEKSDAAKYRDTVMESIGSSFGGFISVYLGKVKPADMQGHLVANTRALAAASSLIDDLVPVGSEGGDALPAIWDEMDQYQQYAADAAEATTALAAAAEANDRAAMGKAFKAVGNSCKGCHDKFRADD